MTGLRQALIRRSTAVLSALFASALLGGLQPAMAQSFTWTGGTGNQFSTAANWGGVAPTSSSSTALTFSLATSTSTSANNNIAGISLNSITFGPLAPTFFVVTGSSMTLFSGGLVNTSTAAIFVNVPTIGLGAAQTWTTATGSTMSVTSNINGNGNLLTLGGASGNLFLSGVISSTSSVVITGPGETFFSGFNTYSGSTTINGGLLGIQSDSNLGVAVSTLVIENGGTLQTETSLNSSRLISLAVGAANIDTFGSTSTLSGVISGAGSLVKVGGGTLILTGNNTYTGGTTVSSGTLSISSDANLGAASGGLALTNTGILHTSASLTSARAITLGGGGTLDTAANTVADYTGTIGESVAGSSLTLSGAGTVILAGANTYTGGLSLNGGTLVLSAAAGLNTYAGGTTLNAGLLELGANDSLPTTGALTVGNGATFNLNGFNQSGLGTVINNGTINAGGSAIAFSNGYSGTGTLSFSADSATITGTTLNFTGGTLNVGLVNPIVSSGTVFTPINATTSVTGSTATVRIISPAAVMFTPTYNPASVSFLVTFVPYSSLAATPNQQAVANVLEPLRAAPPANFVPLFAALNSLNLSQLQEAFDQIGPISLVAMRGLGLESSTVQSAALSQRLAVLAKGGDASGISSYVAQGRSFYPGTLIASSVDDFGDLITPPSPVDLKTPGSPLGFFSALSGTDGHVDAISGPAGEQPSYHTNTYGLTLGGDYRFADTFALGVSGSWLSGHASIDSPASGSVGNHSGRAGVYGTAGGDGIVGNFYFGGALDDFQTNRDIIIPGGFARTATASPRANEINGYVGGSYDLLPTKSGMFATYVGVNYDRLMIQSFTESGADPVNLSISKQTAQSMRSSLGFKYSATFDNFTPYGSVGWRHEFLDRSEPMQAELVSTGNVFTVNTIATPRDGALIGVGLSTKVSANLSVKADYSGDFRAQYNDNAFSLAARYRF